MLFTTTESEPSSPHSPTPSFSHSESHTSGREREIREIPYNFQGRQHHSSKQEDKRLLPPPPPYHSLSLCMTQYFSVATLMVAVSGTITIVILLPQRNVEYLWSSLGHPLVPVFHHLQPLLLPFSGFLSRHQKATKKCTNTRNIVKMQ